MITYNLILDLRKKLPECVAAIDTKVHDDYITGEYAIKLELFKSIVRLNAKCKKDINALRITQNFDVLK